MRALLRSPATRVLLPLTSLRIILVPVVMVLVRAGTRSGHAFVAAAVVFAVAASTDFLDGYLARRWRVTTTLGSFLDTTADKLLVSGALIALVDVNRVDSWIAFIIIGRELVILGLRGVVAAGGTVVEASIWGKLKANVQFLGIFLAMLRYPHELGPLLLDQWVMLFAAVITVISGAEYLLRFSSVLASPGPGERPLR
jgi:CDP-diacylglycerol---glycerol-3-phosphate 3-phosphatidyltransferase